MVTRGKVAVVALVLAATACTGGGKDEPSSAPTPLATPPALESAWTVDLGPAAGDVPQDTFAYRTHGDLDVWAAGSAVVVVGRRGLRAFDVETGAPAWSLRVPARLGSVCATSAEAGPTGVGGLLFATKHACDAAGAVDLATGRLLWTAPLEPGPLRLDPTYVDHPLTVGVRTLTVEVPCDELRRFDLASGRSLREPFPSDESCGHDVALGDGVVAYSDKNADTLTLADADTGRAQWSRAFPGGGVDGVVSTDPLILDVSERGHRVYRSYDELGRPGAYIGLQFGSDPKLLGVLDGVVVVSYSIGAITTPLFRGFDAETGEQLWRGASDLYVAGEQDGRILTLQRPLVGTAEEQGRVWVGRADPRDPTDEVALGSIPYDEGATYAWTDGLLLRRVGTEVEAFPLPDAGTDADADPMPVVPSDRPEPAWADGDVRPEQVEDLCAEVSRPTLVSLGFRSVDLPPPASCQWHDVLDDPDVNRFLDVEVFALAPRGDETAAEVARAQLERQRTDDDNFPGPARVVSGIGDDALLGQKTTRKEVESRLVTRLGNVVVIVHSTASTYSGAPLMSLRDVLDAQRQVVSDLTAALAKRAPTP